jgi:hypothetical protein
MLPMLQPWKKNETIMNQRFCASLLREKNIFQSVVEIEQSHLFKNCGHPTPLVPSPLTPHKNPAKDICWWDLDVWCLVSSVVCRAVVDGSLDLSARATSFFI